MLFDKCYYDIYIQKIGGILMNTINTINAVANVGILFSSICNVVIAFLLYRKTSNSYKLEEKSKEETRKMQNMHNIKSVQPLAFIACNQIGDSIKIEIRNYGLGAMIIRGISIKNINTENQEFNELYKIFPENIWIHRYSVDIKGRPIKPNGGSITLVEFKNLNDKESKSIKKTLGKYKIIVEYQDIYGNQDFKEKNFFEIFCVEYRIQNKNSKSIECETQ